MAAGQDSQKVFWLNLKEQSIECNEEIKIENTIPPVFNDSGNEFLVMDEEKLYRYEFPAITLSGVYEYPENMYSGNSLCYIEGNRALMNCGHQRIFIINLDTMQLEDEVIIEDH